MKFDNLEVSLQKYELKIGGKAIDLPPKELELLYFLASNINRVYTRDQLLDKVWGYDYYGDVRTVEDYRAIKQETGAEGVMIARGAIGHTAIFAEIRGEDPSVDLQADFTLQLRLLRESFSDHVACMLLKPHLISAVSGRRNAKELRYAVGTAKTIEEIEAIIHSL